MVKEKEEKHKKSETKKKEENQNNPKKKNSQNKILASIALIAIVVVIGIIIYGNYNPEKLGTLEIEQDPTLAIVNGEKITQAELDKEYRFFFFVTGYPPEYQSLITKKDFLNQTIAQILLLQEATKAGYNIDKEKAEAELLNSIEANMLTREEFEKNVIDANFTMGDVIDYSAEQLVLSQFIEEIIFTSVEVSDKEINDFYEQNKEFMEGAEFKEVSLLIKQELEMEKQRQMLQTAIELLMEEADIEFIEEPSSTAVPMQTASLSPEELQQCIASHDVSPSTVIFYHADWCPHCKNMLPIVEEMEAAGYSFHYAETSQNIGTEVIECFRDGMQSGVPQFICAGTGDIEVGEIPAQRLLDFADRCAE